MNEILSTEEIEKILKRVRPLPSSYYWSAVIGIMAYAGLKDIEVIELRSDDVDLYKEIITISSHENPALNRQIQIVEPLLIILEKHPLSRSEYLFPNIQANSKKWFPSSFDKELKKRLPRGLEADSLTYSYKES